MKCRSCGYSLNHVFLDLQNAPPSNAFLTEEQLAVPETYFPLKVFVCEKCFLVQIDACAMSSEIFNAGYVYFSSYSEAFVEHARRYVENITQRFALGKQSLVYEAASNDGYLLQFFQQRGVPCCGIEPSRSVAEVAMGKGIPTEIEFFGASFASELVYRRGKADLFIGNNVMAHVPNLNDFVAGIKNILKPDGIATLEFPHLLKLIEHVEFDTIYHEHYSYFSLLAVQTVFEKHGLTIVDIEELSVHGGSLRIYATHSENTGYASSPAVGRVLSAERAAKLDCIEMYSGIQEKTDATCRDFIGFLVDQKRNGKKVAGYGAAAKGNTLLNYCGIRPYLLPFVSDITPAKQGKFLPGSHIPVYDETKLRAERPDYIVILPWNWKDTIIQRLSYAREWGARFVTVIPQVEIV